MANNIRLLDDNTINKIAAGEVVERPASIVKELVENSIDAKSDSIIIEIKNGGKKYIRVSDNGIGIDKEDIDLAFLRHSTSKINKAEDLSRVISLGFRGEALASISAVSQMELITKTDDNDIGNQVEVMEGKIRDMKNVGCPKGTTIIVKNIFFNTPVRKKFLKSDNAESSHISDIVYKLSLSYPNISFKYIRDNKVIIKTPGKDNLLSNIYSIFGKDFTDSLFKTNYSGDDIKIRGFVSKPSFTRGNRKHQYFFINGRYIEDKKISKAIEEAYSTLIPANRFPIAILYINLPPNEVDVNIHPNKIEARFEREDTLRKIIYKMIKDVLKNNNLIQEAKLNKKSKDRNEQKNIINILNTKENSKEKENIDNKIIKNSYKTEELNNKTKVTLNKIPTRENDKEDTTETLSKDIIKAENKIKENNTNYEREESITKKLPNIKIIGKLFSTYLLAEGLDNEAFYMIDQHAAHERIMYEKLKKQYKNENITIQRLLSPEVINLTHGEFELYKNNFQLFKNMGFEIEEFGVNSIILRGVPMIFGKPNTRGLFLDILDKLHENIKSNYEVRLEKIMKISCTKAIKAGDRMETIEINQLLEDLEKTEKPYTCPHGRPVIIKMTKYELEKKFKRIQ
ncbi:MAG: DNA mismatch repair endonuclease MutL [Firmicutes bacterium]|nr:DNA mismatch repair endonuclease MutL [Bacillota bacterium]